MVDVAKGSRARSSQDDVPHHERPSDFNIVEGIEVAVPNHIASVDRDPIHADNAVEKDPISRVGSAAGDKLRRRLVGIVNPPSHPPFDFQLSSDFGVQHCFEGMPDDVFFLRSLQASFLKRFSDGRLVYCDAFGRQDRFA